MSELIDSNFRNIRVLLMGLAFGLVACGQAPGEASQTPTETPEQIISQNPNATPAPTQETSGPVEISLWIPSQFSPNRGDIAAAVFQDHLETFLASNPNVQIEIRIKEEEGPGGMLDSLLAADAAAPLALPDIALLSSDLLPHVIDVGLAKPIGPELTESFNEDWYEFGLQSAQRGSQVYGLPLAGDALVLIHRFSALESLPINWDESLQQPLVIGFAAADPHANYSLIHLEQDVGLSATGNELAISVEDLLTYYAEGESVGVYPFWLTRFENSDQSWQAFIDGQSAMVLSWSSRFITSTDTNLGAGLPPSKNGTAFTLAKSWSWSAIANNEDQSQISLALMEHLSSPEFIAQWTAAAGLLPTRSSALSAWQPDRNQLLANQIVPIAGIMPPPSERVKIGQALSEAVIQLLKQEISVELATQIVLTASQ